MERPRAPLARELPPVPERSRTLGRRLFSEVTVVASRGGYGADVLAQDEKIAAVGGLAFTATEGLEVRV